MSPDITTSIPLNIFLTFIGEISNQSVITEYDAFHLKGKMFKYFRENDCVEKRKFHSALISREKVSEIAWNQLNCIFRYNIV